MQVKFRVCSEIGKRRTNEDYFFPTTDQKRINTFIVCDGIGGHGDGDKAAQFVCQNLAEKLNGRPALLAEETLEFIVETHTELQSFGQKVGNDRMGTTLAMVNVLQDQAIVSWVGDSRVYHIREGRILFQTTDHSVQELLKGQHRKEDESQRMRHIIYQAMGQRFQPFKPGIKHIQQVQKGDLFLLVTDGVFDVWEERVLEKMVQQNPKDALNKISKPEKTKIKDNYTAMIVEVD